MVVTTDSANSQHQATKGVSAVRFKEPCYINPSGGETLLRADDDVVAAAEQVGNGGEVVLIGDFQFMDDGGYLDYNDNALFADKLVIVDPNYAAEADDTGR